MNFKRKCPKCKSTIEYKTFDSFTNATKNNSLCRSCAHRKKQHQYFLSLKKSTEGNVINGYHVVRLFHKKGTLYVICSCPTCKNTNYMVRYFQVIHRKNHTCNKCYGRKKHTKDSSRVAIQNKTLGWYHSNAKRRGLSWNLSKVDAIRLMSSPCHYCGQTDTMQEPYRSGGKVYHNVYWSHNGIDRLNHCYGYSDKNAVPCCKQCNKMKWDLDKDSFLKQVKAVHSFITG